MLLWHNDHSFINDILNSWRPARRAIRSVKFHHPVPLSSFHGNDKAALKPPSFSVYADLTASFLKQRLLPSGAWKTILSFILFVLQNSFLKCGFMDVQYVDFLTFKRIKILILLGVYHKYLLYYSLGRDGEVQGQGTCLGKFVVFSPSNVTLECNSLQFILQSSNLEGFCCIYLTGRPTHRQVLFGNI